QNHVGLAGVRGRKAPETVQTRGRVNDAHLLRAVGLRLDLLDEHEARAPRRAGGTPHRMRRVEGDLVDLERIVVGGPSAAEVEGGVLSARSMVGSHHHATNLSPSAALARFAAAPSVSAPSIASVFARTRASASAGRSMKLRADRAPLLAGSAGSVGGVQSRAFVTSSTTHGFACQRPAPAPRVLCPPSSRWPSTP